MNPDFKAIVDAINRLAAAQQKSPWDYVGTIAGVVTLAVIIWYTVETFLLRKAAQRQNETATMPVVMFHSVPVTLERGWTNEMAIRNLGAGPAFNIGIEPLLLPGCRVTFVHTQTLAASQESIVRALAWLEPTEKNNNGANPDQASNRTGTLLEWLRKSSDKDELACTITYSDTSGKPYRTRFTMNRTLESDSFVVFDGMAPSQAIAESVEAVKD